MAAMHYEGNFNAERSQLKTIDETITKELNAMKETLEGMSAYWKDEKSESFLASATGAIAEIQTKQSQAISDGNNLLTEVENALKIYQ
jgi:hypothetical protein